MTGPALPPPDLSAFPGVTPQHPLAGGNRHSVWLVDTPDGPAVAKTTTRSEDQLRWLLPLQDAARAAGFRVPALIPAPDGRLGPGGTTLEPFVAGAPAEPRNLPALLPRLQAMHRATVHLPQRPGFASVRALPAAGRGGDVDLGAMPPDLAEACRDAWARLTGAECAIHGDITPDNLLMTPEGPALIDWDEARRDLPVFDTMACRTASPVQARARLAWEIAACWTVEPERARRLAAALTGAAP